jgi:hypothetical protein
MFLQLIEPLAEIDPLRAIAEEVAPVIKKIRNELSYIECVPSDSRVLKYINKNDKKVVSSEDIEIDCEEKIISFRE